MATASTLAGLSTLLMRIAGSGGWEHTRRLIGYALRLCGFYKGADADAVLAASVFHYGQFTVREVKTYLKSRGVEVRF